MLKGEIKVGQKLLLHRGLLHDDRPPQVVTVKKVWNNGVIIVEEYPDWQYEPNGWNRGKARGYLDNIEPEQDINELEQAYQDWKVEYQKALGESHREYIEERERRQKEKQARIDSKLRRARMEGKEVIESVQRIIYGDDRAFCFKFKGILVTFSVESKTILDWGTGKEFFGIEIHANWMGQRYDLRWSQTSIQTSKPEETLEDCLYRLIAFHLLED